MDVKFATRPAPRTHHPNEDFIVATNRAVVVLDGLSVPDGMETGCVHGTTWYVEQLGTRLLVEVTQIPLIPLQETLANAINEVASLHANTCELDHPGTPAATVAILRTAGWIEYLVLSDATIVLDTLYEGVQVINDGRVETTATNAEQSLLATPAGSPARDELRKEMISERRSARNTEDGYWVAASSPMAAGHAITGSYRPGKVRQAAVLTDGAARLAAFGVADWPEILQTLEDKGPDELIMHVRTAEASDPECTTWPRSKPHDDATVAHCRIDSLRTAW
jgi:hypothetical protein